MAKRDVALFTICNYEPIRLPTWFNYYTKHFASMKTDYPLSDIFLLDHGGRSEAMRNNLRDDQDGELVLQMDHANQVPVHNTSSYDHDWMLDTVTRFHEFLLQSYKLVVFAEVDEFLVPDPTLYPRGLYQYLTDQIKLVDTGANVAVRAMGYDVLHMPDEPDLVWDKPLLAQRRMFAPSRLYSKQLINSRTPEWLPGFHATVAGRWSATGVAADLLLLHTHRIDRQETTTRHQRNSKRQWSETDVRLGRGQQHMIVSPGEVVEFCAGRCAGRNVQYEVLQPELIPERFQKVF